MDFTRRAPFWSYRVKDYLLYEPLVSFRGEIDSYLNKLFAGDIDEGNGDVLDNMIADLVRQAEESLKRQRAERRDVISSSAAFSMKTRSFSIFRSSAASPAWIWPPFTSESCCGNAIRAIR